MRFLIFLTALIVATGCANARLERLAQAAQPFDSSSVEKALPTPKPVRDTYEVTHRVQIKTNHGAMVIGLYGKDAPNTVDNFLTYVKSGFYSGMIFHRVIPGFMIQGGGYDSDMQKAETASPIELELIPGMEHHAGTVSMARTTDPKSATSQFFVCVAETVQLNGEYAAFGKLEEGIEVLEKISLSETGSIETEFAVMDDVPVSPVVIESITLL